MEMRGISNPQQKLGAVYQNKNAYFQDNNSIDHQQIAVQNPHVIQSAPNYGGNPGQGGFYPGDIRKGPIDDQVREVVHLNAE